LKNNYTLWHLACEQSKNFGRLHNLFARRTVRQQTKFAALQRKRNSTADVEENKNGIYG